MISAITELEGHADRNATGRPTATQWISKANKVFTDQDSPATEGLVPSRRGCRAAGRNYRGQGGGSRPTGPPAYLWTVSRAILEGPVAGAANVIKRDVAARKKRDGRDECYLLRYYGGIPEGAVQPQGRRSQNLQPDSGKDVG